MPNLNCVNCGNDISLGIAYWDYKGDIKCNKCNTLLTVRIEGGILKEMRIKESQC